MYIMFNERCRRKKEASKVKQTTKQSNTAHPRQSIHIVITVIDSLKLHVYVKMYMYTVVVHVHI